MGSGDTSLVTALLAEYGQMIAAGFAIIAALAALWGWNAEQRIAEKDRQMFADAQRKSDVEIAHQKLEIEEAKKETALALLEAERIKERLTWRRLLPESAVMFRGHFSGHTSEIVFLIDKDNQEAYEYAESLASLFALSGFDIIELRFDNSIDRGVRVSTNRSGFKVLEALAKAGVFAKPMLIPHISGDDAPLHISVGEKEFPTDRPSPVLSSPFIKKTDTAK